MARTLAEVGPRLQRAREARGVTLTSLAAATGISKSTLSRLESGQRKPSLELLLPIAQAHRVPLDQLVAAPEIGDPRIHLTPHQRNGRTVVPLSQQPDGPQAWKVVIPPEPGQPKLRMHEGYEWFYVISGELPGCRDAVPTRPLPAARANIVPAVTPVQTMPRRLGFGWEPMTRTTVLWTDR